MWPKWINIHLCFNNYYNINFAIRCTPNLCRLLCLKPNIFYSESNYEVIDCQKCPFYISKIIYFLILQKLKGEKKSFSNTDYTAI